MTEDTIFVICIDERPIYYTDRLENAILYCQDYFNTYVDDETTIYSKDRNDDFTFTLSSRSRYGIIQYDRVESVLKINKVEKL